MRLRLVRRLTLSLLLAAALAAGCGGSNAADDEGGDRQAGGTTSAGAGGDGQGAWGGGGSGAGSSGGAGNGGGGQPPTSGGGGQLASGGFAGEDQAGGSGGRSAGGPSAGGVAGLSAAGGSGGTPGAGSAGLAGQAGGALAGNGGVGGEGECNTPPEDIPSVDAWAREVLLGLEFGAGEELVRRFAGPIEVSMIEGTALQRALLADVTGTLSEVLAGTDMQLTLTTDENRDAAMQVWFVPYDRFEMVAAAEGFTAYPDNWGQFYVYWDGSSALTRAYVLLASDLLLDEELVHFTFEEVTQALGPASDSSALPDSIFFQDGGDGGDAQGLSCYDEALLYLLYAHLGPGDGAAEVTEAVELYWDQRPR